MQIIIFYTRKKCNFLFHLSPQSVKVVIHRGFTYGDRLIATYHQPINLSPSFPLIKYPKKAGILLLSPFHSSYLALILLGHHGREEKLPQLWQDISTSMTRSYHGRGDLTIPVSFSYFSYYFWVLSLWDILLFSICPETNSMDVSAFPYTHLLNKV